LGNLAVLPHAAMFRRALALVTALLLSWLGVTAAQAGPREFTVGEVPAWVKPIAVDWRSRPPQGQISEGVHYLLSDMQQRVSKTDRTSFRRSVATALNERGVESLGHVEVGFDPSYQTLMLHTVTIHRDGRAIQKLAAPAVRVLQREKELEYRIFDGTKTANVFIDDLRVGDTVEYSYSLTGRNPVFANRQFGRIDLQWSVPVAQAYRRLLLPAGREISLKQRNTTAAPRISETPEGREYVWEASNQPALVVESSTPAWFDPYAAVEWSEFDSWRAVARWAEPLYRVPGQISPAMQAAVDQIAASSTDPGERLLATLRFVQREVRYLGVEVGPGSHAPNPPQLVMERRFGDCKDKTMLTVSLLRRLGIEAQPALVNTALRGRIAERSPSPAAFNHVIVRARLAGKEYWLDPTRAPQQGTLETVSQANFGAALVVDAASDELVAMPAPSDEQIKREVEIVFDMRSGYDKPVRMTVTSIARGSAADGVRSMLASQSPTELQNQYLNFYARYYPKISVAEPFSPSDDKRSNETTITEQYLVTDLWKKGSDDKRDEFAVHVPDLRQLLELPRESIRKSPLALSHPLDVTLTTRVLLPDRWAIKPDLEQVKDPAFDFEQRVTATANSFKMTNRFVSRADHVDAADVERYTANLEKARGVAGYRLYRGGAGQPPAPGGTGIATAPLLIGLCALALWSWLGWKLYQFDPVPAAAASAPFGRSLRGIGGWLVLVAFGIIASPVRILYDMSTELPAYQADRWALLTTAGSSAYHPMWGPLLVFELVANLGLLVASLVVLVLFFQKRSNLPRVFIVFMVSAVVVQVVDVGVLSAVRAMGADLPASPGANATFARTVFGAMIWCAYFVKSERVKMTFVERLRPRPAPEPAPETVPETVPMPPGSGPVVAA